MKRQTVSLGLAAALGMIACKPQGNVDEIRQSLPTAQAVQVKLPGTAAASATSPTPGIAGHVSALLGQTATFYTFTRSTSVELNGGAAWVLMLVRTIVSFPVTSIDGDTYIWGPWHEALSPSEYRLTVVEEQNGDYTWSLEGRRVADGPSAAYESVVSGVATPGRPLRGSGHFLMDFETAEKLDAAANDGHGQLAVAYDLESEPLSIAMDYTRQVADENGVLADATAHYEYREAADGSGDFVFQIYGDLDDDGSAWEDADVRSRWQPTGAGRSDIIITHGDLGALTLVGSECWDTSFARVFWTDSLNWAPTEGDAGACAFASADMP